ncbi:MAG: peptide deformylase [bacterium]
MLLKILTVPNPILRQKAMEIEKKEICSENFRQFVFDMTETMKKSNGIGLAAPQAGKSIQVICIDSQELDIRGNIRKENYPNLEYNESLIFINPRITRKSLIKNVIEEGCLSIPGKTGNVKRSKKANVTFLNMEGKKLKLKATGLLARVLQHEIDHLNGILFIDKMI